MACVVSFMLKQNSISVDYSSAKIKSWRNYDVHPVPQNHFSSSFSIITEEMLHLALVANLLNAVGGSPRLTDLYWLPNYPTYFPSKHNIQVYYIQH